MNLVGALPAKALKAGAEAVGVNKLAKLPIVEDLAKKFIPYHGLDKFVSEGGESYQDLRRLAESTFQNRRDTGYRDALEKVAPLIQSPEHA